MKAILRMGSGKARARSRIEMAHIMKESLREDMPQVCYANLFGRQQQPNNFSQGVGTCVYVNGGKATGEFKDMELCGKGRYVSPEGIVYEGRFSDGRLVEGTKTFLDGSVYSGEFVAYNMPHLSLPNGKGTLTTRDNIKYTGPWVQGLINGEGKIITPTEEFAGIETQRIHCLLCVCVCVV